MNVINIPFGGLETTASPFHIPNGAAQSMSNVQVETKSLKLSRRFRTWQPTPSGSGYGFGFGYYNGTEEVWAFSGGNTYKVNSTIIPSQDGTVSAWSADLDSTVTAASDWIVWQVGKYLFAANETNGIRWKQIGSSYVDGGVTSVPELKEATTKQYPGLSAGVYEHIEMDDLTITITNIENDPTWGAITKRKDRMEVAPGGGATVQDSVNKLRFDFETPVVAFGDELRRYVYFVISARGNSAMRHYTGGSSAPVKVVALKKGDNTQEYIVPCHCEFIGDAGAANGAKSTGGNAIMVRMDFKDCPFWPLFPGGTTDVGKLDIYFTCTADPNDDIWVYGFFLAGQDVKSLKSKTYNSIGVSACYVDLDGADGGKAYGPLCPELTLNSTDAEGYNPYNWFTVEHQNADALSKVSEGFPKGGTVPNLTVFGAASPPSPLSSSDKIAVFLRIGSTMYPISEYTISDYDQGANVFIPIMADPEIIFKRAEQRIRDGESQATVFPAGAHGLRNMGGSATCGCFWQGSNVVAKNNGYLYFSRVNAPFEFWWGSSNIPSEIDPGDLGMPQIVQVGSGDNSILGLVPVRDVLFIATARDIYYLQGKYPSRSGTPKIIPKSMGVLGKRSFTAIPTGMLYASRTGLYVIAPEVEPEELTVNNRGAWETLLGSTEADWASVCVAVHGREIYAYCKNRYLIRDAFGNWLAGSYPSGNNVKAVYSDHLRGVILQFETGHFGIIGDFTTDGGTNTMGSNGTAVTWRWRSKKIFGPMTVTRCRAAYTKGGSSSITVKVRSEMNPSTGASVTLSENSWEAFKASDLPTGAWVDIEVSGNSGDVVDFIELEVAPAHAGN